MRLLSIPIAAAALVSAGGIVFYVAARPCTRAFGRCCASKVYIARKERRAVSC